MPLEPALKLNGTVCPLSLAPFDQLDVSEILTVFSIAIVSVDCWAPFHCVDIPPFCSPVNCRRTFGLFAVLEGGGVRNKQSPLCLEVDVSSVQLLR